MPLEANANNMDSQRVSYLSISTYIVTPSDDVRQCTIWYINEDHSTTSAYVVTDGKTITCLAQHRERKLLAAGAIMCLCDISQYANVILWLSFFLSAHVFLLDARNPKKLVFMRFIVHPYELVAPTVFSVCFTHTTAGDDLLISANQSNSIIATDLKTSLESFIILIRILYHRYISWIEG